MLKGIVSNKAASDSIEIHDLLELMQLFGQLNDRNRQVLIGEATAMVRIQNEEDHIEGKHESK